MTGQQNAKFALVVFDAAAAVDAESVDALERLLRNSERFALGFSVRVRAAALTETPNGAVCAIALAGLPPGTEEGLVAERMEAALQRLGERGAKFDKPRNLALAAIGDQGRVINDGAAAVRHLLDQVGPGSEPFGKILRLFTPPGIDIYADLVARRASAQRLRAKLAMRIQDMLADAGKDATQKVGFVEATAKEPEGLVAAIEAMLGKMDPVDPAVSDIVGQIRTSHAGVAPTLAAFLSSYRKMGRDIEQLCAELKREDTEFTRKEAARFAAYAEAITRTSAALEKLMK
jgi:hypothetical protein